MSRNFCKCKRDRVKEMNNADTDWQRTAILTHYFLTTLSPYSGPHLALQFLSWDMLGGHSLGSDSVTDRYCQRVLVCICPYIPVVNPCELLTPTHCLFSSNYFVTQLKHPVQEIPD